MRTTWAVVIALAFLATVAADGNETEPAADGNETVLGPIVQESEPETGANETDPGQADPGTNQTESSEPDPDAGTGSEEPDPTPTEPTGEPNGTPSAEPAPGTDPTSADPVDPAADPDPTQPDPTAQPTADPTQSPDPGPPDEPDVDAGAAGKVVAAGRGAKQQVLDAPLPPAGTVALAALFSAVAYAVLRRH